MTTVLFIHGLESGPQGHKARQLAAAGFEVVSAQMPCNPRERWKDPAVLGVLATPIVLVNAVIGYVQEQRAAIRLFEAPAALRVRTGERALFVTEEL